MFLVEVRERSASSTIGRDSVFETESIIHIRSGIKMIASLVQYNIDIMPRINCSERTTQGHMYYESSSGHRSLLDNVKYAMGERKLSLVL